MFRKLAPKMVIKTVTISVDGVIMEVEDGEAIAAVLLRVPPFISRTTPVDGGERAPYCIMGVCFECLVEIDGVTSIRSCMSMAYDGMVIRRQLGRPVAAADILT